MIYLLKICRLRIDRHTTLGSGLRFLHLQPDVPLLQGQRSGTCCEVILPFRLISAFQKAIDYVKKSLLVVYEASVVGIWTHPRNRWRLLPAVTGSRSLMRHLKILACNLLCDIVTSPAVCLGERFGKSEFPLTDEWCHWNDIRIV